MEALATHAALAAAWREHAAQVAHAAAAAAGREAEEEAAREAAAAGGAGVRENSTQQSAPPRFVFFTTPPRTRTDEPPSLTAGLSACPPAQEPLPRLPEDSLVSAASSGSGA